MTQIGGGIYILIELFGLKGGPSLLTREIFWYWMKLGLKMPYLLPSQTTSIVGANSPVSQEGTDNPKFRPESKCNLMNQNLTKVGQQS